MRTEEQGGRPTISLQVVGRRAGLLWGPVLAVVLMLASRAPSGWLPIGAAVLIVWGVYSPWGRAVATTRRSHYSDPEVRHAVRRLLLELGSLRQRLGLRFDDVVAVRHQPITSGAEVDLRMPADVAVPDARVKEALEYLLNLPGDGWSIDCAVLSGAVRRMTISRTGR